MIEVDLELHVRDGARRFDLAVNFRSEAPVVALFGPSGGGKSLTLQAIAGLLRPDRGLVRLDGRTLYDSAQGVDVPAERRHIGYVFQHYALFPHLSVVENVEFGLTRWNRRRVGAGARARVDALLDAFGLAELAAARPAALSGGQRQRVALARALACDPKILLLDEPLAALNPMLRQSLREELAATLRRARIPSVLVSHDVEDVLDLADLAFVVEEGRVVREIDLRRAESRERSRRELLPGEPQRAPRGNEDRLRRLLGAPPRRG